MNKRDVAGSIFWILVGSFFCVGSLKYGLFNEGIPGPGLLPFLGGIILIFLGLMVFVVAFRKSGHEKDVQDEFFPEKFSLKKIVFTVMAIIFYLVVLEYSGFLLTTFFFMLFLFRFIEPKKWTVAITSSVLIASFFYILFQLLLKVQLPRGIWGI